MDDEQIIELYMERSENAISETAQKYGIYCKYIAGNILQNEEDSEECVNDALLRAWNSIPPNRPACLRTYLGKITRNLAINKSEQKKAKKRGGDAKIEFYEENGAGCAAEDITEEQITESLTVSDAVNRFLEGLAPVQRKIFVRRYWYMSPVSEIAREYGINESKVTVSLFRMRKKLRAALEKEGITI